MSRLNKGSVGLLGIFLLFSALSFAAPKYPQITEIQGQAWVTGKDNKRALAKRKQGFIERAFIETALSSTVKVDLDGVRSFIVKEGSEVLLPSISWETGQAPVVILKKGALRWQQPLGVKTPYNVALRTDLFEFIPPAGDYVFVFMPAKAMAEVQVFEGSIDFSALNGEESVVVKTGQRAGFQGLIEGGQIVYDVLLKGRKIPRGHLTEVLPLDQNELKLEEARLKEIREQLARKKAQQEQAIAQAKKEGYICEKPRGRLNECTWTCEGNSKNEKKICKLGATGAQCVRTRCNANGEWAERKVLSAEIGSNLCAANPVVGPCDY